MELKTEGKRPKIMGVGPMRMLLSLILLGVIVTIFYPLLSGTTKTYKIISRSMEPELLVDDYVLMKPQSSSQIRRGQVVVLDDPLANAGAMTKRVLAVGDDRVELKDGTLYINNQPDTMHPERIEGVEDKSWIVPQDHVFVVGDNRNQSMDSLDLGPQPTKNVHGVLTYRYWPWSRRGEVR
jgi:signal peptidase I